AAQLGSLISRRPFSVALVSAAILIALSFCALGYSANFNLASAPKGTESAEGLKDLEKGFPPGAQEATQVWVHSTTGRPLPQDAPATLAEKLKPTAGVGRVGEPLRGPNGTVELLRVQLTSDPLSKKAMSDVAGPVRDTAHAAATPGTEVLVGGQT